MQLNPEDYALATDSVRGALDPFNRGYTHSPLEVFVGELTLTAPLANGDKLALCMVPPGHVKWLPDQPYTTIMTRTNAASSFTIQVGHEEYEQIDGTVVAASANALRTTLTLNTATPAKSTGWYTSNNQGVIDFASKHGVLITGTVTTAGGAVGDNHTFITMWGR